MLEGIGEKTGFSHKKRKMYEGKKKLLRVHNGRNPAIFSFFKKSEAQEKVPYSTGGGIVFFLRGGFESWSGGVGWEKNPFLFLGQSQKKKN